MILLLKEAVIEILGHSDYVLSLGWTMTLGITVGAILNDGLKQLKLWGLSALCITFVYQLNSYIYWSSETNLSIFTIAFARTIIVLIIYGSGLMAGWVISHYAKLNARKSYERYLCNNKIGVEDGLY